MVKITFLGACQQVGRSGVLIESEDTGDAILCDYGTQMDNSEQKFPDHVSGKNLSAIVLTHSHIDHSGGIPLFYISGSVPLFCTKLTFKITEVLLQDMINISNSYLPFEKPEIMKMKRYTQFLDYGKKRKVGKTSSITLFDAGHIPGSAMVLVEIDGKKILYTGDINTTKTQLLEGLNSSNIPEIDAIITETTYGTTDHSDREQIENDFLKEVQNVYDNKGIVLIPAFGVSRSQEMLMVLQKNKAKAFPIVVDGMARKVSHIYLNHSDMLRDGDAMSKAVDNSHFINQRRRDIERKNAFTTPGVIVAPSGMLKGGTSRLYAESILDDEKNAIYLVSYQIENSPGRVLIDKKLYIKNDPETGIPVKAQVKQFEFSSHSGRSDLINFLNSLKFKSEKLVYCVHGDAEVMKAFAEETRQLGYRTETPVQGQSFNI